MGMAQITGTIGERLAEEYLNKKGYKTLERNFKKPFGEIDLIMKKGKVIAFVEVKTRSSLYAGTPAEALKKPQQGRIKRIAEYYLLLSGKKLLPRFDVVEIYLEKGRLEPKEINHIENAFC